MALSSQCQAQSSFLYKYNALLKLRDPLSDTGSVPVCCVLICPFYTKTPWLLWGWKVLLSFRRFSSDHCDTISSLNLVCLKLRCFLISISLPSGRNFSIPKCSWTCILSALSYFYCYNSCHHSCCYCCCHQLSHADHYCPCHPQHYMK